MEVTVEKGSERVYPVHGMGNCVCVSPVMTEFQRHTRAQTRPRAEISFYTPVLLRVLLDQFRRSRLARPLFLRSILIRTVVMIIIIIIKFVSLNLTLLLRTHYACSRCCVSRAVGPHTAGNFRQIDRTYFYVFPHCGAIYFFRGR